MAAKDEIIQSSLAYERLSDEKREFRKRRNEVNWNMWNLNQDYSHKLPDQSQEFIPKMPVVLEQLVATVLQALTARSGDFFIVEQGKIPDAVFTPGRVHDILLHFTEQADTITVISDGLRYVGLDGLVTAKITSSFHTIPRFEAERGIKFIEVEGQTVAQRRRQKVTDDELKKWRLAIDLIPFDDFHFDPTPNPDGKKLFEMHAVERDLHDLIQFGEYTKIYDMDQVNEISESFIRQEEQARKNRQRDEPETSMKTPFRKRVTVKEFWGTLLDNTGEVIEKDAVWAIANDEFLIRPPEKNPRFDGESPFVSAALLRNPQSVYGRGMMDSTSALNHTFNELVNLVIDGAAGEAQNVVSINKDALENPKQVEDGVTAGMTLITNNAAAGPAMQAVQTGRVPGGTLEMINRVESWALEAGFANELKLGQQPAASTKATAIVEAQQSIAGVFGSLTRVFEDNWVTPVLEKSWATILQNMGQPHFMDLELVNTIGAQAAQEMLKMEPEERFARGMAAGKIEVRGISGFVNRLREFQKLTTLLGVIGGNPLLLQSFQKRFSMDKMLGEVIKATGIRMDSIEMTDQERQVRSSVQNMVQAALQQAGPPQEPQQTGPSPREARGEIDASLQSVPGAEEIVQ